MAFQVVSEDLPTFRYIYLVLAVFLLVDTDGIEL